MSSIEKGRAAEYESDFVVDYGYEPSGWMMFAGLMVFFVGLWNLIEGSIAVFRTTYFAGTAVFGSLFFWALVWFAIGLVELVVGYGIISGRSWSRWVGVGIVAINTVVAMLTIPLYPWWSLFVVTLDVFILYALTVRWRKPEAVSLEEIAR